MRTSNNQQQSLKPAAWETEGDIIGADQLFREHSAYVSSFLRRLGIAESGIDDAVQDVFLVVHSRGGYRPGTASARTWLGAITIRVAANARRARRRRREVADDQVLEHHTDSIAPDVIAEQREELAQVERTLLSMSDAHRLVFLRFAISGHSCDDIALAMGVPTGTVYSRLHAARSTLGATGEGEIAA